MLHRNRFRLRVVPAARRKTCPHPRNHGGSRDHVVSVDLIVPLPALDAGPDRRRHARGLRKVARAFQHRREAVTLARMDDRMLADIGLTRSDLRDAYGQPLWTDPTTILAARAKERRSNRHDGAGRQPANVVSPALVPGPGFSLPRTDRPARYTL
ncbi:MAG: DUF1127 domain-containing protein [Pseudorhodoplanes sp.]|nr:DUF1127 domain-containing protein [Pseudorhodoplanes sp.]